VKGILIVDAAQCVGLNCCEYHLVGQEISGNYPVINRLICPRQYEMAKKQIGIFGLCPLRGPFWLAPRRGIGIERDFEQLLAHSSAQTAMAPSLQALGYDSYFDTYKGVVTHVRIYNGILKPGMNVKLLRTGKTVEIKEVGSFNPKPYIREELRTGETGYFTANIKSPLEVKMGDTLTDPRNPSDEVPGFQEVHPMVFSGLYPVNSGDFEHLKVNLAKLQLNDPAFVYQVESSAALGFGFRCGFLGLLHMEIVQERLRREYEMAIIATYPSVVYHVKMTSGEMIDVDNPVLLPEPNYIQWIEEPVVRAFILCPNENIGDMLALVQEKRGVITNTETLDSKRVMLSSLIPLNEILIDFHDRIKSTTRGYGSMDYEHHGYQRASMVKLDIMVNNEPVDAFSCIVHRDKADSRGRALAAKLKEVIPSQPFAIPIQAAVGVKIVARETVRAYRKDVTAKCYGGDITRKRKLLEKQKEGKKRMKAFGSVNIPQEAFIEVLKA
jgi:GTP-binding protein LepA